MQVKMLQQQSNLYNSSIKFCSTKPNPILESENIEQKKQDKQVKCPNKILLVGAGLSTIAIAGILIAKKRTKTSIIPSVLNNSKIATTSVTDSKIPDIIKQIKNNLSNDDLQKLETEFKKIQSKSSYGLITANNKNNFEQLQLAIAIEKAKINTDLVTIPKIIVGVSKNQVKLTSLMMDSEYSFIKYNKGSMEEFFTMLNMLSSKSQFNFNIFQKRTFLEIENLSEFISDIKNKGNETYHSKWMDFAKNEDNSHKITLAIHDHNASQLEIPNKNQIDLNFPSNFNKEKSLKDYETYLSNQATLKPRKIGDEISKYAETESSNFIFFSYNLLLNQPDKNIFILGQDEKATSKVIEILSYNSNSYVDNFDCSSSINETLNQLAKKRNEAQNRFTRTGLKTLLNIKGIEKYLNKDADLTTTDNKALREFIEETKNQNILTVCSINENIHPAIIENNSNILFNTDKGKSTYTKAIEDFKKNDLSSCSPEQIKRFETQYLRLLTTELRNIDGNIPNGILLQGKSEVATTQFLNAIKSLNVNQVTITHNPQKPLGTIEAILNNAENAENLFKKTKKRTILLVENLDEMLSDYSTIEKRGIISRFKGLIEHLSKDYHTTLVMKTNKPLEIFDAAAIAGHRFEVKILVDK